MRPKNYDLQEALYSGYKKIHCFKYEIAVRPFDGKICWIAGPSAGSTSDPKILQKSGLLTKLRANEIILADKIYLNHRTFI